MATIHALSVTSTVVGSPRASATVTYDGTSDKSVLVQLVCPTWATENPAMSLTVDVQQSFDGGTVWASFAKLTTQGGRFSRLGGMPQMGCQCVDGRGVRLVRIVLSIDTGALSAGVDLTT